MHFLVISYNYYFVIVRIVFPRVGDNSYRFTTVLVNSKTNYAVFYFGVFRFSVPVPMPMIPPNLPLTVKINVPTFGATAVCNIVVGLVNTAFPVKGFPIRKPLGDKVLNMLND